jgi:peptide-methionine (S)-S-oxide reductase
MSSWVTTDVVVGYSGGVKDNPTYEEICTGMTGHAEVVEVLFDENKVAFESLLEVFWDCHDPTQLNFQGPDIGTQYRSAIFTQDEDQTEIAMRAKKAEQDSGRHRRDIVTEISPAKTFWRAEDYHQQYIAKRRGRFGRLFG